MNVCKLGRFIDGCHICLVVRLYCPLPAPLSPIELMSAIHQSVPCPALYKANLPTGDFLEFASHWHYSRLFRIN